jgi:beta-galactosidase
MRVETLSSSAVDVISNYILQPQQTSTSTMQAVSGLGVGEVGGAHWFANSDALAAATADVHVDRGPSSNISDVEGTIGVTATFTVHSCGSVSMKWEFDATQALPAVLVSGLTPSLARVGLRWQVPCHFNKATWYGFGPHECYPDRKASAHLRQHSM